MDVPPPLANDPNPIVIAIYAIGFLLAFGINLYALWTLVADELVRRRSPGDVPGRVDFPAGPGLTDRRDRPD
jgi:hypothetical protein